MHFMHYIYCPVVQWVACRLKLKRLFVFSRFLKWRILEYILSCFRFNIYHLIRLSHKLHWSECLLYFGLKFTLIAEGNTNLLGIIFWSCRTVATVFTSRNNFVTVLSLDQPSTHTVSEQVGDRYSCMYFNRSTVLSYCSVCKTECFVMVVK